MVLQTKVFNTKIFKTEEQQRLFSRGGGISTTISLFPHIEDEGEQKNATIMLYFMSIHFGKLQTRQKN